MAGILSMLAITACSDNDAVEPVVDYDAVADHTVLMYMVGDCNLSNVLENNVIQAHKAILDSVALGKINLVIFKDNKKTDDSLPKLYWVHRNATQRLDTVLLRTWDTEIDSADPDLLADVVKTTFTRFNSTLKGLVLASHGSSWIPLINTRTYGARRRAFGLDESTNGAGKGSIELWDLGEALLQCPHLDYIITDCCHFGTAEVLYQLRDVTRYLVGSTAEVQGAGMPYQTVITRLSKCSSVADLPAALDYAALSYYNLNTPFNGDTRNGATDAVYDLTAISSLADSYQQLVQSNSERLNAIAQSSADEIAAWTDQHQEFGREYVSANGSVHYRYYFHDIVDAIDWMSEANPAAAVTARTAVGQIVLSNYFSHDILTFNIDHSSGLAVTLPQALELDKDSRYTHYFSPFSYSKLVSAYRMCDWGKKIGY